jgi:hypothetical protein
MSGFDVYVLQWIEDCQTLSHDEKLKVLDSALVSFEHYKAICASDGSTSSRREYRQQGKTGNGDAELYQRYLKLYNKLIEEKQEQKKESKANEEKPKEQEPSNDGGNQEKTEAQSSTPRDSLAETKSGQEASSKEDKGKEDEKEQTESTPAAESKQEPAAESTEATQPAS